MTADDRWNETSTFEAQTAPPPDNAMRSGAFKSMATSGDRSDATGSRRAHLRVSRVSPWSVAKFSFVVALVCFIVLFVAVAVLYGILSLLGVFAAISSVVSSLTAQGAGLFSVSRILGYTAFLGAINVVLITLLATVGAFIYNLVADLVGGVEMTLSERD